LKFLHRNSKPQRAQSSRKDRKVFRYIFAIFAGTLRSLRFIFKMQKLHVDFCRGNPLWLPFSQESKHRGLPLHSDISTKILEEPKRLNITSDSAGVNLN